MSYIFAPSAVTALPIAGSYTLFPVRRVFCVGQNYAKHAAEMGAKANVDGVPVFFMKPPCCITLSKDVPYPPKTANLHHEVELAVALSGPTEVFGCAVALDLTRRDLQTELKAQGRPWELGKVFDFGLPMGALTPGPVPGDAALTLSVNGVQKQNGRLSDMIWPVPKLLEILSSFIPLAAGDILLTGTPDGVGPLVPGDHVVASITGLGDLSVAITPQKG
jgi:fumarylpyruvate hydrolase